MGIVVNRKEAIDLLKKGHEIKEHPDQYFYFVENRMQGRTIRTDTLEKLIKDKIVKRSNKPSIWRWYKLNKTKKEQKENVKTDE